MRLLTKAIEILEWLLLALGLLAFVAICALPSHAQFLGYTSPQTVQAVVLNGVSAPQTAVVQNIGQNLHMLTYTTNGGPLVQLRLEASNDGLSFFPISSDIGGGQSSGVVYANGYFPVVRVNLVTFIGGGSVTVSYSGTSSSALNASGGAFNPSLANQLLPFVRIAASSNQTSGIFPTPYGSTRGLFLFSATGALPAGTCKLQVNQNIFDTVLSPASLLFTFTTASTQVFQVPDYPATSISFSYFNCGATATLFSVSYMFAPPGGGLSTDQGLVQPLNTFNSETASAVNTAVTKSIAVGPVQLGQRVHLYSVSARCSAGTAQLQVKDGVGGTVIWSSAATEVGTTTFKYQWSPGLASSPGNGMDIVLGTCGAGNTGTLDVEASQL